MSYDNLINFPQTIYSHQTWDEVMKDFECERPKYKGTPLEKYLPIYKPAMIFGKSVFGRVDMTHLVSRLRKFIIKGETLMQEGFIQYYFLSLYTVFIFNLYLILYTVY